MTMRIKFAARCDLARADGQREDGAFAGSCGAVWRRDCELRLCGRVSRHGTGHRQSHAKEERARVPHHLIDVAEPDEPFTAGEYSRQARAALREIAARGRLPIVTGGTGLYLRALTEGLFAGPARQRGLAGAAAAERRSARGRMVASRAAKTGCGDGGTHTCERHGESDSRD